MAPVPGGSSLAPVSLWFSLRSMVLHMILVRLAAEVERAPVSVLHDIRAWLRTTELVHVPGACRSLGRTCRALA